MCLLSFFYVYCCFYMCLLSFPFVSIVVPICVYCLFLYCFYMCPLSFIYASIVVSMCLLFFNSMSFIVSSNQEEPVDIFESPSAQPQRQSANTKDLPDLPVTSDLAEGEAEAVEEFLKSHQENGGVVCLMEDYLMCLSKQFLLRW